MRNWELCGPGKHFILTMSVSKHCAGDLLVQGQDCCECHAFSCTRTDWQCACSQFPVWNSVKGIVLEELAL